MQINNRLQFGKLFNKMNLKGHGAEIGVQRGDFSAVIRNTWNDGTLHLIDRWVYDENYDDVARLSYREQLNNYLYVVNRFAEDFGVKIYRLDSVEATNHFPDDFFDWIYIDADHSYEGCTRDLNAWYPKLKKGGIFCGHDFLDGIIPAGNFGVKTAVEEFIKDKGIILFVTTREEEWKSWYFVNDPSFDITRVVVEDGVVEKVNALEDSVKELLLKAESLIESGDYSNAKIFLDKILFNDPRNLNALIDLSVLEIQRSNHTEADILIQYILYIDPDNEIALGNYKYLIELNTAKQ